MSGALSVPAIPGLATRASGLARLNAFLPQAGRDYASGRNHDEGTQGRTRVSLLSPWIRHRLLTEPEVVAAVLARHAPAACAKFVQEVCWRTYWIGWLEQHPQAWTRYCDGLQHSLARLEQEPALARRHQAAVEGRTGIACFDAWATELAATGYLHNHARMWTASIWIFTLGLPWELGADWFLRHLADADPASNTLSWRWVGGLQTRGKHYLARAANIAEYTAGRFDPRGELNEQAPPLAADAPFEREPLRLPAAPVPGLRSGLLLTPDDLHPESAFAVLPSGEPAVPVQWAACGVLDIPRGASPFAIGSAASRFRAAALEDAGQRWTRLVPGAAEPLLPETVVDWARRHRLRQVVVSHGRVGSMRSPLDTLGSVLEAQGIAMVQWQRRWDAAAWPHATRGFFAFRERIGALTADCAAMSRSA